MQKKKETPYYLEVPALPNPISKSRAVFLRLFGKLEKAEARYKEALIEHEAFKKASFWASKRNYIEAGNCLLYAAEKIGDGKEPSENLSESQFSLLQKAIECYKKWQESEGKSAYVLIKLGECCHYLRQPSEHAKHFAEAIRISGLAKADNKAQAAQKLHEIKHSLLLELYSEEFSLEKALFLIREFRQTAKKTGKDASKEAEKWLNETLQEYANSGGNDEACHALAGKGRGKRR
ncbi:MAG: hypothetical protein N3F07_00115 [Candidatus Micrarchaeota archaeon]|nr:hypothetical protein [Candidatus Micrarchaeota archaeon]